MCSLLQALYDYQPSVNDKDQSEAWISTLEKAYINLARYNFVHTYSNCKNVLWAHSVNGSCTCTCTCVNAFSGDS